MLHRFINYLVGYCVAVASSPRNDNGPGHLRIIRVLHSAGVSNLRVLAIYRPTGFIQVTATADRRGWSSWLIPNTSSNVHRFSILTKMTADYTWLVVGMWRIESCAKSKHWLKATIYERGRVACCYWAANHSDLTAASCVVVFARRALTESACCHVNMPAAPSVWTAIGLCTRRVVLPVSRQTQCRRVTRIVLTTSHRAVIGLQTTCMLTGWRRQNSVTLTG